MLQSLQSFRKVKHSVIGMPDVPLDADQSIANELFLQRIILPIAHFRTELCKNWAEHGVFTRDELCNFAHGLKHPRKAPGPGSSGAGSSASREGGSESIGKPCQCRLFDRS